VAALPWRLGEDGRVEILLVTSRRSGRWLIPKGHRMVGRTAHRAAAIEAEEEAGVRGVVSPRAIGSFQYRKRDMRGDRWMTADVYALRVTRELTRWKEMHQRRRGWFPLPEARALVTDPDLIRLLTEAEGGLAG
jgi:8-oxo-dGTP pyrophosphatase MutT (NUDIX family)